MKLFKYSDFLNESEHEQILPSIEDIKSYFIEFEDEDYLINIHVGEALDFRDIKNKSMVFEKQKFIRVELVPPNISDLSNVGVSPFRRVSMNTIATSNEFQEMKGSVLEHLRQMGLICLFYTIANKFVFVIS
jgi:hypothetical protein